MNKKFLSAILFGTLMVTSTGTFVSCKDYDDDIDNLQTQIDANKTAISELKNLVGDGNYVTSVTVSGQNLVVNTKNGSTTVALPACEGGTQAEVKDNELFIDGKATGIKVAAGEAVKVVEGEWAIQQADGSYKSTNIPASGVTVTGDEKDGYILTIVDAEGEETVIELPTAASAITSLSVNNGSETTLTINWFNFLKATADQKKAWKEATGREVGINSYILYTENGVDMRVNPVTVDAKEIDFTLVNAKNETFPLIVLSAAENKDYTTVTRAAYGNGLYTLKAKPVALNADATSDENKNFYKYINNTTDSKAMGKGYYAVAANSAVRAEYNMILKLNNTNTVANFGAIKVGGTVASSAVTVAGAATVKAGVEAAVTVEKPSHLYDLYLTAKAEDINIFGIVFSADKKSFTITKSPDQVTAANFVLTVHTMDNEGLVQTTPITITLSEAIDAAATYETRTLAIDKDAAKNFFKADMATMTTALGGNLDLWKRKVAFASVAFYKEATCETPVTVNTTAGATEIGIALSFVDAEGKAAGITAATDMKFAVTNTQASKNFAVNTVYYAKVSFSNGTEVLNSVVVPFQFTVPALSTFFEVEPAVFTEGVAYAYMTPEDRDGASDATYKLSRAFKKFHTGVAIALNNETKIVGDYKSTDLASMDATFTATSKITLKNVFAQGNVDGTQVGYAKELIITATEAAYEGWKRAEADQTYTFKIKMMSPIFEGTISSVKTSVEIPVTSTEGYKMGNSDIEGKTYGAVAYKVFQDGYDATATPKNYWTRPEIKSVTGKSENVNVAKLEDADATTGIATAVGATPSADGKSIVEGYLKVLPQNIENTTDVVVNLTVEDIWGYKKVSPITVTVKK